RRILATEGERPGEKSVPRLPPDYNLYDKLEAEPGASEEELRRAYRRVRDIYGPDSMAVCGLYSAEALAVLSDEIEEAYDRLVDADRRRDYDRKLWPDGVPRRRGATPALGIPLDGSGLVRLLAGDPARAPAPEPLLSAETEFTGELLRQVREARGIDL